MPEAARSKRATPEVAPFIVEAAGDLERPTGGVPTNVDLRHLPGEGAPWAGAVNLLGWVTRGIDHLRDQTLRYGPVYRHRLGKERIVCVTDPEVVSQIGRNRDRAWSAALAWRVFFEGTGDAATADGLTSFDFTKHTEARRLLQPAFTSSALAGYVRMASEAYETAIDDWIAAGRVSFKAAVRRLFARIAGRIFMGVDDPEQARVLDGAMADYWGAPRALVHNQLLSPTWRRAVRASTLLREHFSAQISRRRAEGGEDLFSLMCSGDHGVEWIDDPTLVRLFLGVMVAAFDTTSLGVASMAQLLAEHPEWQQRLREEGQGIDPHEIVRDDARRLVAHDWAWKESLRRFPVASSIPRRALREVEIGGYRIPAGALVIALWAPSFIDPARFTNPRAFDPERFSPERAEDKKMHGSFSPFGFGAHTCIGARLATLEAIVFWHALLSRARIRLADAAPAAHQFTPLGVVRGPVDLLVEPL